MMVFKPGKKKKLDKEIGERRKQLDKERADLRKKEDHGNHLLRASISLQIINGIYKKLGGSGDKHSSIRDYRLLDTLANDNAHT